MNQAQVLPFIRKPIKLCAKYAQGFDGSRIVSPSWINHRIGEQVEVMTRSGESLPFIITAKDEAGLWGVRKHG